VTSLATPDGVGKLGGPKAVSALKAAAPTLGQALAGLGLLAPFFVAYFTLLSDAYGAAKAYLPPSAAPIAWGLILCFFGGDYVTLIAAMEAYELCGGEAATAAVRVVAAEASAVLEASSAEDAKDAGAKGAAPVAASVLLRRKALLVARMTHPEALTAAAGALWLTWMGVLATLKLRFARTLALGVSISNSLAPVVARHALPALDAAVAPELRKWNATAVSLALKAAVVLAALCIESAIAAVHSALRGGALAARHGLALLSARGLLKGPVDDKLIQTVGLGLAALGVLSQAAAGFSVPFPFSLATWPLDVAEWAIRWQVAVGPTLA
jgi:hypothetical protein